LKSGRVFIVSGRNEEKHSLSSSSKQDPVTVDKVCSCDFLADLLPNGSTKPLQVPVVVCTQKIASPAQTDPIEFETLNLKFICGDLKLE